MAMQAAIKALEYHLPERVLTNAQLAAEHPDWPVDELAMKLGIDERRVAAEGECSSDLAIKAAEKLFVSGACKPGDVDFLLFCTQSPDYFLPTTACLLQHRLGISTNAGAFDFNLGCSGFIYGLSVAKGLIETGQARSVLLLMAETYTKFLHPNDKSRLIFGDAASAVLVQAVPDTEAGWAIGPACFGTDGSGGPNLMVAEGGLRNPEQRVGSGSKDIMLGPEVFSFTSLSVPKLVRDVLERAGMTMDDVDLFVFHQANHYMVEHLRKKIRIPQTKFWDSVQKIGNTVSSTIPIALRNAWDTGRIHTGQRILLAGFGVGYSWAGTVIRWTAENPGQLGEAA